MKTSNPSVNSSTAPTRNAVRRQRRPLNSVERMQNVRDILDQALQIAQETMACLENKRAVDTQLGKKQGNNSNMGNNNNKGK